MVHEARLLDDYIVCTEDSELMSIAASYNAKILERPVELAGDSVNRWDVLKFVVSERSCDSVVLLQATSPIRTGGLVDDCIRKYTEDNHTSLATGFYLYDSPYPENRGLNRQEIKPSFYDDGNVYIWDSDLIRKFPFQEAGERPNLYETTEQENIDINSEFDLWIAEKIIEDRLCKTE